MLASRAGGLRWATVSGTSLNEWGYILRSTRQADDLQISREQFDCVYQRWIEELEEESIDSSPVADSRSIHLFQKCLDATVNANRD